MYDRNLDFFIAVVDSGSFSKAAQKLFISPNAVIKHINTLENTLKLKLFDRSNRGVTLTRGGKEIYEEAKKIIDHSKKAIDRAKKLETQKVVRLGTSMLFPCKTIVDLWNEVLKKDSSINLEIVPFNDEENYNYKIIESLGRDIDVIAGIYPSKIENFNCQIKRLKQVPICFAVSSKNPLADKKVIDFSDLDQKDLIMIERGDSYYIDRIRDEIESKHPNINIIDVTSYGPDVFNECEKRNAVMLSISTWKDLHPSLVTIASNSEYTVPYGLMYSKKPSKAVLDFLSLLDEDLL